MLPISPITFGLIVGLVAFVAFVRFGRRREGDGKHGKNGPAAGEEGLAEAPGPRAWPVIGNLHVMGGYEVPYQAFSALANRYGDVVKLKLGSVNAVVVNGQDNIREVLVAKGHHFDARPNFERYHMLFCGDKENSLAFSNFSDLQKTRREMLRVHTFPRSFTTRFQNLDEIISTEVSALSAAIERRPVCEVKGPILHACANVFANHFCSRNFGTDEPDFLEMVENFDEIFYEVNQGYAADFLPFLLPLHKARLAQMSRFAHRIREFIEKRIVEDRLDAWTADSRPQDYVESLIDHVRSSSDAPMSWDTALFALEDIIGGHSAVGNLLVKVFAYLVREPAVQSKIQAEVDAATRSDADGNGNGNGNGRRKVTISDRNVMPYTEAVVLEAIRLIASPIVPRVANQDSTIAGFRVPRDTVIFLNNYDLSMSEKLWEEPALFKPERFLQDGRLVKPEHFLPYGGGRRSCMGYKMVQLLSFGIVSGLLQDYNILPVPKENYKVQVGSLALPTTNTYRFRFEKR